MTSDVRVLPHGMKRDGRGGKNTVWWNLGVEVYGSLDPVSAYDIGYAEGMNEEGAGGL